MLKELITSMRPAQWYKNLVVFVGLVFSLNFFNYSMLLSSFIAFIIFCMLSGSGYIINDIRDIELDRAHPKKRNRPIASKAIGKNTALSFALLLSIVSLWGAYTLNVPFFIFSVAYLLLVLLYSLLLKNLILVDMLAISTGFVLRAVAGCLVISVVISPWLIICAFLLALFLALGKRNHELILVENASLRHKLLDVYSAKMLEQMIIITTSALVMSYSLYTFLTGNAYLMLTIPFAIYGVFRYLFLINSKNLGSEPQLLLKDHAMLLCVLLWILVVILTLYYLPTVSMKLLSGA